MKDEKFTWSNQQKHREHRLLISFPEPNYICFTYSDLKKDDKGEYLDLYVETISDDKQNFKSAVMRIPDGEWENTTGMLQSEENFTDEEKQQLRVDYKYVEEVAMMEYEEMKNKTI